MPVPGELVQQVIAVGLGSVDPWMVRATCSAIVNFVFFNRSQSVHLIALEDLRVEDDLLVFRKRRTKLKPGTGLQSRVRSWPSRGAPEILDLVLRWSDLRDKAWADAGGTSGHFYTLPGERDPGAQTMSGWFVDLLKSLPSPPVEHFDHHSLHGGGASACYVLEVPER